MHEVGLTGIEIIPSTVPEAFPKSLSPFEYVLQTAVQKATTVYAAELDNPKLGDPALVIAADTIVISNTGQILEKPRSEAEHIAMLKSLRDEGRHQVFTAVAVMAPLESARDPGYAQETVVEETTVRFDKDVTDEMILAYVKTREGVDKAGGYGIQGIGAILVERIEGSFDNVVGLPLRKTLQLIEKVFDQEVDDEFTPFEDE
jgi:septum formation protein